MTKMTEKFHGVGEVGRSLMITDTEEGNNGFTQ